MQSTTRHYKIENQHKVTTVYRGIVFCLHFIVSSFDVAKINRINEYYFIRAITSIVFEDSIFSSLEFVTSENHWFCIENLKSCNISCITIKIF